MAVVTQTQDDNDEFSPQSPEPSEPSPISTPPMNFSTFNSWETPHTTTDDNTFYSSDEPRLVYWTSPLDKTFDSEEEPRRIHLFSSPSPRPPPRKMKRKLEIGMSFPKKRRNVAAHLRSLRSDDPLSEGHPRSIEQELETVKTFQNSHTYY